MTLFENCENYENTTDATATETAPKTFTNEDDFLNHLEEVEKNTEWDTTQTDVSYFENEENSLIFCTPAYRKEIRDIALPSISLRADIYGSSIGRLYECDKDMLTNIFNRCFELKNKNIVLRVLEQYGKINAIHSSQYCIIPMTKIFSLCKECVGKLANTSLNLVNAYWSFEQTTALYHIDNDDLVNAYKDSYQKFVGKAVTGVITPAIRVTSSDIATNAVTVNCFLLLTECGRKRLLPLTFKPTKVEHKGIGVVSQNKKFEQLENCFSSLFSVYQKALLNIENLMKVKINNPLNCLSLIMKDLKFPLKLSTQIISKNEDLKDLAEDNSCTAFDVYAGLTEVFDIVEQNESLQYEELISKALLKDFKSFDVAVMPK